jgi:hypothetical protein
MLFLGVAGFNLFYLSEKYRMLQTVNQFHAALINNDKAAIDDLLTDEITESGERHFVQTPEVIHKRQVLNMGSSKLDVRIETPFLKANIFGNGRNTLFFVRKLTIPTENGSMTLSDFYGFAYTFEEGSNGSKISKIKRHF